MTSIEKDVINSVCVEIGEKAQNIISLVRKSGHKGLKSSKVQKGDLAKVLDAIVCHLDGRRFDEAADDEVKSAAPSEKTNYETKNSGKTTDCESDYENSGNTTTIKPSGENT